MNTDFPDDKNTLSRRQPDSPGFRRMFAKGKLTLGAFFPLAAYAGDANREARPIHLGFELGRARLLDLLHAYQEIGVNQVALVFKLSHRPVKEVIQELAEEVVPCFPANPV